MKKKPSTAAGNDSCEEILRRTCHYVCCQCFSTLPTVFFLSKKQFLAFFFTSIVWKNQRNGEVVGVGHRFSPDLCSKLCNNVFQVVYWYNVLLLSYLLFSHHQKKLNKKEEETRTEKKLKRDPSSPTFFFSFFFFGVAVSLSVIRIAHVSSSHKSRRQLTKVGMLGMKWKKAFSFFLNGDFLALCTPPVDNDLLLHYYTISSFCPGLPFLSLRLVSIPFFKLEWSKSALLLKIE